MIYSTSKFLLFNLSTIWSDSFFTTLGSLAPCITSRLVVGLIKSTYVMGDLSLRNSSSFSGSPTSSPINRFQCSGTALANVTRLLGPTISTAAFQLYCGNLVMQLRVANPPKLAPNTPILLVSIHFCEISHFTAPSKSLSSFPPQSWYIFFSKLLPYPVLPRKLGAITTNS